MKDTIYRADAIEAAQEFGRGRGFLTNNQVAEFQKMIKEIPPVEDTTGDLISRAKAIEKIDNMYGFARNSEVISKESAKYAISELPSAEAVYIEVYRDLYEKYVELKHASAEALKGKWIRCEGEIKDLEGNILCHIYWYECDQCGSSPPKPKETTMTKRYYIAGPITGADPEDTQLSFYRMERRLLDSGFRVYNPAALPEGLDWGTYMQMALAVLCSDLFDGIIMLRGWSRSKGAQIERLTAQALGIPVFYEDEAAKTERSE